MQALKKPVLVWPQVSYPDSIASSLHNTPVYMLLSAPFTSPTHPHASVAYTRLAMGALRALASIILAVVLPTALGWVRVMTFGGWRSDALASHAHTNRLWPPPSRSPAGTPMVWFTSARMGYTHFVPLGIVGALLPWLDMKERAEANEPSR